MGTNIISKTLSRLYTHPTRAKQNAKAYAEKMWNLGYNVHMWPTEHTKTTCYMVDVFRKK